MADDRSERLRRRRKRSSRQAAQSNGASSDAREDTDGSKETESDGAGETDDERKGSVKEERKGSVKEERTGTYMYLPEDQLKELRRLYNVLKAEYEFEFDEEFEKNRHFYPLVVQCGLDGLDDMDVSDVREKLKEV